MTREKRASNKGHFEEMKKGNLERECIEETCNGQELYEVGVKLIELFSIPGLR